MRRSFISVIFWIIPFVCISQNEEQLMERVQVLFKSGKLQNDILADTSFMKLHSFTPFRELMKENALAATLTIVTPEEPGQRITVKGKIMTKNGDVAANALIYVYQTDYKGWYADTSGHIKMMEGDRKYARLFGFMRTGPDGRFEFNTIRAGGYPDGVLPGHIHFEVFVKNNEILITELLFDDDIRMNEKNRAWAKKEGFQVSVSNRRELPVYVYELSTN